MWKNESGIVKRNKNTHTVIFVRITNNKALAECRKRCMVQVHTATIKQRYNVGAMRHYYRNLFMATATLNVEMI